MQKAPKLNTEEALKISAPSWPLQNTVAVNPFWFLRGEKFNSAIEKVSFATRSFLFMPLEYYRDKMTKGEFNSIRLNTLIQEYRGLWPWLPNTSEELFQRIESAGPIEQTPKTLSEFFEPNGAWNTRVLAEMGKYCSAYFDNRQAIARFPWSEASFWEGWVQGVSLDRSMELYGIEDFPSLLCRFKTMTSEDAIADMMEKMGITSETAQLIYLQRLVASVLGWSTQFKYSEWQHQLGYVAQNHVISQDLLAVRLAYDFSLYCRLKSRSHSEIANWKRTFELSPEEKILRQQYFQGHSLLLLASELNYQEQIARQMRSKTSEDMQDIQDVKAQLVFCIDVRSEILRRHLEAEDSKIQTLGFAGFFGMPFDYKLLGEHEAGHRLPVLLTPAFKVTEGPLTEDANTLSHRLSLGKLYAYFRQLRKNPLSSFVYVELFGGLYIEKMIRQTFLSLIDRLRGKKIPHRFDPRGSGPSQLKSVEPSGAGLSLEQRVNRAETALRHMGLTQRFAPVVMIVGHGSATTNNAFGSSLDCGACGGHAGDINARLMADLLNDPEVRKGISFKGIEIPFNTWFVASVHETVTDEVFILEPEKIPSVLKSNIDDLSSALARASHNTQKERLLSRSDVLDPRANRRATNWSEVRPEWGLAGNACFIVAPRSRTRGIKLNSRSFLHDYDWRQDQSQGYKTLELIMTAPMVVTNWINLQYYASTVAPAVFGSGNKVLHNLTGESGVVEGNGGDLRVGLPIQSVHDGQQFVHEPLRLSVFIEAPRQEIEKLIEKHEVVRQLIEQEWLHLIHIDTENLKICRRKSGGDYVAVNG